MLNSFGFILDRVEGSLSFLNFFVKHKLSSFKFSAKIQEEEILINTPILDVY